MLSSWPYSYRIRAVFNGAAVRNTFTTRDEPKRSKARSLSLSSLLQVACSAQLTYCKGTSSCRLFASVCVARAPPRGNKPHSRRRIPNLSQ